MLNCYRILEVRDYASSAELKAAYRRLSKKYHPDVTGNDKALEEKFKEVQRAYDILSDPYKKSIHDQQLHAPQSASTPPPVYERPYPSPHRSPGSVMREMLIKGAVLLSLIALIWYLISLQPDEPQVNWKVVHSLADSLNRKQVYQGTFTLGSVRDEVIRKQGLPPDSQIFFKDGKELWEYKASAIIFRDGRVYEYANLDGSLHIRLHLSADPVPGLAHFTTGDTRDAVIQLQGTPTAVLRDTTGKEIWSYGESHVVFQEGRVLRINNAGANLHLPEK